MAYTDNHGQRHKVVPTGVWCRSNICGYGGLENDPLTEHPKLDMLRIFRSDDAYFSNYCNMLAVTGTERNEKISGGARKFVESRLTLQTVVMYVVSDQNFSDQDLLRKFSVLTPATLSEIRETVQRFPPPDHGKVKLELDVVEEAEPEDKPFVVHLRV